MRQFYLTYPEKLHARRGELSWTHYRLLLKVKNDEARAFYETEVAAAHWGTRELERQINSLFFERTALSKQKRQRLERGRTKGEKYAPHNFIKAPVALEFLQLRDVPQLTESHIETALLDHLQEFLLELGKGFTRNQKANRKRQKWNSESFALSEFLRSPSALLRFAF